MLLDIRPLLNFADLNTYQNGSQFQLYQGDATQVLTFRIIDASQDTAWNNYKPSGRPYYPAYGVNNRQFISSLNGVGATLTAAGLNITISLSASNTWTANPVIGDTITIPTGSVLAGAGNANVGNYILVSFTTGSEIDNTTATLTCLKVTNVNINPVNVSVIPFSATPNNDLQDFSTTSTLYCTISPINNSPPSEQIVVPSYPGGPQTTLFNVIQGNLITRWASQPYPQQDPSIWQLTIFPSDYLAGTSDILLTLNENSQKVTNGIAKGVIVGYPSSQINASAARMSQTNVYPVF